MAWMTKTRDREHAEAPPVYERGVAGDYPPPNYRPAEPTYRSAEDVADIQVVHDSVGPGEILGALAGVVMLVFGIAALVRCGIDSSPETPFEDVFGLAHTATFGYVELAAGLLLIAGAAGRSPGVIGFVGALLIAAGTVAVAAGADLREDLGLVDETGWFILVVGAVALFASLLPSVVWQRQKARRTIR